MEVKHVLPCHMLKTGVICMLLQCCLGGAASSHCGYIFMQTHQIGNSREQTSMMARAALKIVLIPTEKYTYTVQSRRMRSAFPLPQSTSLVPPLLPPSPLVLFYHSSTPSSSSLHWPNTPKFSPFPSSPPPPLHFLPHFSLIHPLVCLHYSNCHLQLETSSGYGWSPYLPERGDHRWSALCPSRGG